MYANSMLKSNKNFHLSCHPKEKLVFKNKRNTRNFNQNNKVNKNKLLISLANTYVKLSKH